MAILKWKNELLVNTTTAGNQNRPSVTALADGGFVIAWHDLGPVDSVIRWQRYDALGARVGAEHTILGTADDQERPDIVQLASGDLWFIREDSDTTGVDIDGSVYTPAGSFVRAQVPATGSTQIFSDPRATSLDANGSVAVYRDNSLNGGDIRVSMFDATGLGTLTFTANTNAATLATSQSQPDVAVNTTGSQFVVVWTDDTLNSGDIRARVFSSATGNEFTAEFSVNALTGSIQREAAVAWISPTKFVTVWETSDDVSSGEPFDVKYIIRNADGTAFGAERLANSATFSTQGASAVTALPDGGFAIAWVDFSTAGGDASSAGLKLQVFDGAGNKRGGEILVNTTTPQFQGEIDLATLADGRIIATWRDDSGTDSSLAGVRAQIIDPREGVVAGTGGDDTLYGHDSFGDVVSGYEGDDIMHGLNGDDTFYGALGNDDAHGGKGDDTAYGGDGNDILIGGLGDDDLFGENGVDDMRGGAGADYHDGGAGIDIANYTTSLSSITVALDGSLAGTADAAGDTFTAVEDVRGANIAGAGDLIHGNSGGNSLTGFAGDDNLNGRAGNDKLTGGLGTDTLTGELGNDQFIYNATTEGGDTLTDFSSNAAGNNDIFRFKGSAFGGLPAGSITAAQFQSSTANVAANANVRFFYETDTRILRFDVDGSGAGAAVVIATLQAGATLAIDDISIF